MRKIDRADFFFVGGMVILFFALMALVYFSNKKTEKRRAECAGLGGVLVRDGAASGGSRCIQGVEIPMGKTQP